MLKPKKNNLDGHEHEEVEEADGESIFVQDLNLISLYGDVNEKRAKEIVLSLFHFREQVVKLPEHLTEKLKGKNDELLKELLKKVNEPLQFLISTHGGSASDMFSIYDTMNMVKKDIKIKTLGMGKVMSAGVLLMASGTKGMRELGKNCRVMIHPVQAGAMGGIHDIENEFNEISMTQELYIEALAKETKMKTARIKKLIDEKRNIYISAEEAISYGIADRVAV
jgi:ATP-dependent Clp endopeptidase proteolytic subunit ClpP